MSVRARNHQAAEKTSLTNMEKIEVAYFHECRGLAQHILAEIYKVNPARVANAISAIREATTKPEPRSR